MNITVAELISQLEKMDPDAEICIHADRGETNSPAYMVCEAYLNPEDGEYYSDEVEEEFPDLDINELQKCVLIYGE